jgi:hypothetical protein
MMSKATNALRALRSRGAALLKGAGRVFDTVSIGAGTEIVGVAAYQHAFARRDVYTASQRFFEFLRDAPLSMKVALVDGELRFRTRRGASSERSALANRILMLIQQYSNGCHAARQTPASPLAIEAAALGLARYLCIQQRYEDAHGLIKTLASLVGRTIYLRAAEHAIGLLLKQEPVPLALQKFVGTDARALKDHFCPIPFARADVHQGGEVLMCCAHWLPTPMGNVFDGGTNRDILNSEVARDIRRSVLDGSFKYCSHSDCELIVNNKLPLKRDYVGKDYDDNDFHVPAVVLEAAFAGTSFDIDNVSFLTFCLDQTCNLSCPSCRADVITIKGEARDRLYDVTERAVLPMLRGARRAMINPAGEAFVSRPSRRLLAGLSEPGYENVVVDIITNGTVCNEEEWDKFSHLYGRIHFVRVSMDAATKGTFERLRRGAHFETVVANLRNIANMRRDKKVSHFTLSFTYQRDNVHEMQQFIAFGKEIGVSALIFERLQAIPGAMTADEFRDRAVHLIDHPLHAEFLRQAKAVKKEPMVYIDYNS